MLAQIRPALVALFLLTLLTGVAYPLAVTGVATVALRDKAEGSLIRDNEGNVVGSRLIGQNFSDPKYFWGRLSATSLDVGLAGREGATQPVGEQGQVVEPAAAAAPPSLPYNAENSVGTNFGPTSPELTKAAQARIDALKEADPDNDMPIPVDLVTASASGLDPDISPAAALYQVHRVAKARGFATDDDVHALVLAHVKNRDLGVLGEARVNVLELNLALEASPKH